MVWILGIVILILLIAYEGFRNFAFVIVGIIAFIVLLVWQYGKYEEKQSKSRIQVSEVEIEEPLLQTSYSGYSFHARVLNQSNTYTLTNVYITFTFKDCNPDNMDDCVIVAEEDEITYVDIPPNQVRDIEESIYLPSTYRIKGKMVWH